MLSKISILSISDTNGVNKLLISYDQECIKDGKAGYCGLLCGLATNVLVVEKATHDSVLLSGNSDISSIRDVVLKKILPGFSFSVPSHVTIADDICNGYHFVSNFNVLLGLNGFSFDHLTSTDSNSVDFSSFLSGIGLDISNYTEDDMPVVDNKFPLQAVPCLSKEDMYNLVPEEIRGVVYKTITPAFQHSIDCYQYDDQFQICKHFCTSVLGKDVDDLSQPYVGFILHGEAGSTKSSFVDAIAAVTGYPCFVIPCNDATKLDTTLAFNKPNNDETSVRNFVVGHSPLTKLLPLTKQGVRVILCCDEGNQGFISFLKNLTSGWTSGSFVVKTDTFEFDIRNLIIFVTMNPDKVRKIEPSVFSRLLLIRRPVRTLEQKILYDSSLATVDDGSNNLFVINPYNNLVTLNFTNAKGIGQSDNYNLAEGDYMLSLTNVLDVQMPEFLCGDDVVNIVKPNSVGECLFHVKGLTTKYIRPKLHLERGDSKLTFVENARIEILYSEMQKYLREECPVDDLSSSVNDHYEAKLDSRHYRYFLALIFMFRSVGFACYFMLYNIIQPSVVKFVGNKASEYASLSNEGQARQFALDFIKSRVSVITSLHDKLFSFDPLLLTSLTKTFVETVKNTESFDAKSLLAIDEASQASSSNSNNTSSSSTVASKPRTYAEFIKNRHGGK